MTTSNNFISSSDFSEATDQTLHSHVYSNQKKRSSSLSSNLEKQRRFSVNSRYDLKAADEYHTQVVLQAADLAQSLNCTIEEVESALRRQAELAIGATDQV